jgi:hypothetical protein
MPVARIITTSAKYSNGLADDLRSRGFQVLTSAPGDSVSELADLEITLNECLADEARATVADTAAAKDMRVFLTPQAFAGNIRSIEMFVLTPKRSAVQKLKVEESLERPLEPSSGQTSSFAKTLDFAAPGEVASPGQSSFVSRSEDVTAAGIEASTRRLEEPEKPAFESAESAQPHPQSGISRALMASRQSAWPDMAAMKLVPAELAPAPVRSGADPFQTRSLPQAIPVASAPSEAQSDRRFWKIPIAAGIAAVLALSAVWLASHLSVSRSQPGTTSQQATPSSVEAGTPGAPATVSNPALTGTVPSSTTMAGPKASRKLVRVSSAGKAHAAHPKAKRHYNPDDDYVAKDTTIYFSRQPTSGPVRLKPQARR